MPWPGAGVIKEAVVLARSRSGQRCGENEKLAHPGPDPEFWHCFPLYFISPMMGCALEAAAEGLGVMRG